MTLYILKTYEQHAELKCALTGLTWAENQSDMDCE